MDTPLMPKSLTNELNKTKNPVINSFILQIAPNLSHCDNHSMQTQNGKQSSVRKLKSFFTAQNHVTGS